MNCNANEDEEKYQCANAIARKRDDERAHHGRNRAACAEAWNARGRVAEDLGHHGHDAAGKIEDEELEAAHRIFDLAPEGPQVDHVADDVHPASMHEHRGQQRDPVMAVQDADRDRRPRRRQSGRHTSAL